MRGRLYRALGIAVALFIIAGGGHDVRAQAPSVTLAGLPVHCTDAVGAPVLITWNQMLNDIAVSSILPTGVRLISLRPNLVQQPALLQLFVFAHECGHHISGDIVAGVYFHHDNLNREKNADRIGIRLVRDQLKITLTQAQQIASMFINNPPLPPYYLPGPARAQFIVDCYKSNDDSCSGSTADYRSGGPGSRETPKYSVSVQMWTTNEGNPTSFDFAVDGDDVGSLDNRNGRTRLRLPDLTKGSHSFSMSDITVYGLVPTPYGPRVGVIATGLSCSGTFQVRMAETLRLAAQMTASGVVCSLR